MLCKIIMFFYCFIEESKVLNYSFGWLHHRAYLLIFLDPDNNYHCCLYLHVSGRKGSVSNIWILTTKLPDCRSEWCLAEKRVSGSGLVAMHLTTSLNGNQQNILLEAIQLDTKWHKFVSSNWSLDRFYSIRTVEHNNSRYLVAVRISL